MLSGECEGHPRGRVPSKEDHADVLFSRIIYGVCLETIFIIRRAAECYAGFRRPNSRRGLGCWPPRPALRLRLRRVKRLTYGACRDRSPDNPRHRPTEDAARRQSGRSSQGSLTAHPNSSPRGLRERERSSCSTYRQQQVAASLALVSSM
eukprot:scaffold155787_cov29-Tisochrysis_lutea.AAC.5